MARMSKGLNESKPFRLENSKQWWSEVYRRYNQSSYEEGESRCYRKH